MNFKSLIGLSAVVLLYLVHPGTVRAQRSSEHEQSGRAKPALVGLVPRSEAPAFTLRDATGKIRRLADFRGRPVVLFFFCGCNACAEVMRTWGQAQRTNPLFQTHKGVVPPITLVVYTAEAADVVAAAKRNTLSLTSTVLFPDPDVAVSLDLYQVEPCPRVFVLDSSGIIRYTNNHADDAPQKAPTSVIASKTITSLRAIPSVPTGATSTLPK